MQTLRISFPPFKAFLVAALLVLSLLRLIWYPFVGGDISSLASGASSILLALFLFFSTSIPRTLYLIVVISLIFLPSSFLYLDPVFILPAYLETISPYILISFFALPSKLFKSFQISVPFVFRLINILFWFLVFGQLLQLLGFQLPVVSETPISADLLGKFSVTTRITSFVGSSGPFSFSLAFLSLAIFYLQGAKKLYIIYFALLLQILSFSRAGFAVLLVFLFAYHFTRWLYKSNIFLIRVKATLIFLSLLSLFAFFIIYYYDTISPVFSRIFDAITSLSDAGNQDRVGRMSAVFADIKNPISVLIGHGTGTTSRFIGGDQYESQLFKIFYEWGLFGVLAFLAFINSILSISSRTSLISSLYLCLPAFLPLFLSASLLQIFTSSPIVISVALFIYAFRVHLLSRDSVVPSQ